MTDLRYYDTVWKAGIQKFLLKKLDARLRGHDGKTSRPLQYKNRFNEFSIRFNECWSEATPKL
jgi:hypothetical protein